MPTYQITAKNGGIYEIDAADDSAAMALEQHINSRIDAGDPDITQAPPNTVVEQGTAAQDNRPTDFTQGFAEGAAEPLYNMARGAEWLAEKAGVAEPLRQFGEFINPGAAAGSVDEAQAQFNQQQAALPTQGSGFGRFVGNVAGTLPTAALPGGPIVQGAAGGMALTKERDAVGIAKDAALGSIGSKLGDTAFRAVASAIAPRVSDSVRTLIDAGVRLSPGQSARTRGGIVSGIEDKATSLPGVGGMITRDRVQSLDDFNRAAINRALEPVGEALPESIGVGRRAIKHAGDTLSKKYDELLPNLRATGDEDFLADLDAIQMAASDMLPERATQLNNILTGVGRFFSDGSDLDGDAIKAIETRLNQNIRRFGSSQDADQQQLGDALSGALDAMRDLVARQNPEYAGELSAINKGWKSLTQVERASGNSTGVITPGGYSQAVKASSDTVRRRGYSRGDALNQDLSDAASEILPSQYPDSGTAGRLFQSNLLGLGLSAAATPGYAAARKLSPLATRQTGPIANGVAGLVRLGAPAGRAVGAPLLPMAFPNGE